MIRLRYPNIAPCEMVFYRTSSARHYYTSLQHPCPPCISLAAPLDCELQSVLVLCLGLHMQPRADAHLLQCPDPSVLPAQGFPHPALPQPHRSALLVSQAALASETRTVSHARAVPRQGSYAAFRAGLVSPSK